MEIKDREGKVLYEMILSDVCIAETIGRAIYNKVSLARADLTELDLSGLELTSGDFKGADFTGTNLQGSSLRGCDFKGANFTDVNAKDVNFAYCCLSSTNFSNADLTNADVSFTNLRFSVLENAKLVGMITKGAKLSNALVSEEAGKIVKSHNSFIQITPVGISQETLIGFKTEKGIFIRLGTFFGSVEKFNQSLELIKKNGVDIKEYEVILQMLSKLMEDNLNEPVET